jgi:hypothetical protein
MTELKSISEYLPKIDFSPGYPDRSVEYAVAYALNSIGIKSLKFGSFGPKSDRKAGFNSATIRTNLVVKEGLFFWALLKYFNIRYSGGGDDNYQQASWHENIQKEPGGKRSINYFYGRHFSTETCSEFLLMVNGYLTWFNQKESE